eukprot:2280268-Pleurochrysis_carterae.AAC.1
MLKGVGGGERKSGHGCKEAPSNLTESPCKTESPSACKETRSRWSVRMASMKTNMTRYQNSNALFALGSLLRNFVKQLNNYLIGNQRRATLAGI